jgi:pyroglutamyl-peptidase
MPQRILLTSFQTWLPHQKTNSSDDLLNLVNLVNLVNISRVQQLKSNSLLFLRQLPVDIKLATQIDYLNYQNTLGHKNRARLKLKEK